MTVQRAAAFPLVLLALGAAAVGCGPAHVVNEGPFAFEATEVLRDDCSLLPSAADLWDGDLLITGEVVRMDYALLEPGIQMVGRFIPLGDERFTLDGSAANVVTAVNGQDCLLDFVTVHLEGDTVCDTRFDGAIRVRYEARRPESCVCELWVTYRAVQGGAACE